MKNVPDINFNLLVEVFCRNPLVLIVANVFQVAIKTVNQYFLSTKKQEVIMKIIRMIIILKRGVKL